jgi:IS6 family transposase
MIAVLNFVPHVRKSYHNQIPRVITVDKNPAYPITINKLKNEKSLSENIEIRQVRCLNKAACLNFCK